mgnify:CR=1 FL=1
MSLHFNRQQIEEQGDNDEPTPQVATVLLKIKRIMTSVERILNSHPPGAVENVKNLSLPQVKNPACGFGDEGLPPSPEDCVQNVLVLRAGRGVPGFVRQAFFRPPSPRAR